MTKEEILNMPEGENMDALVAERVMGWHKGDNGWGGVCWLDAENRFVCGYPRYGEYEDAEDFHTLKWHPSESILWAWEVVERLGGVTLIRHKAFWHCVFDISVEGERDEDYMQGNAAPLAICRAALLATI